MRFAHQLPLWPVWLVSIAPRLGWRASRGKSLASTTEALSNARRLVSRAQIAQLLIEQGADPTLTSHKEETPLDVCCSPEMKEALTFMVGATSVRRLLNFVEHSGVVCADYRATGRDTGCNSNGCD